jgi:hypothetical protein
MGEEGRRDVFSGQRAARWAGPGAAAAHTSETVRSRFGWSGDGRGTRGDAPETGEM